MSQPKRYNRWRDREELRPGCLSRCCGSQNAMRSIASGISCQKGLAPLFKYNFLNSAEPPAMRHRGVHPAGRLKRWYDYNIMAIWSIPINVARGFVGSPLIAALLGASWLEAPPSRVSPWAHRP